MTEPTPPLPLPPLTGLLWVRTPTIGMWFLRCIPVSPPLPSRSAPLGPAALTMDAPETLIFAWGARADASPVAFCWTPACAIGLSADRPPTPDCVCLVDLLDRWPRETHGHPDMAPPPNDRSPLQGGKATMRILARLYSLRLEGPPPVMTSRPRAPAADLGLLRQFMALADLSDDAGVRAFLDVHRDALFRELGAAVVRRHGRR